MLNYNVLQENILYELHCFYDVLRLIFLKLYVTFFQIKKAMHCNTSWHNFFLKKGYHFNAVYTVKPVNKGHLRERHAVIMFWWSLFSGLFVCIKSMKDKYGLNLQVSFYSEVVFLTGLTVFIFEPTGYLETCSIWWMKVLLLFFYQCFVTLLLILLFYCMFQKLF